MAGAYAAEHASALADIRDAGAAVTFTKTVMAHNPATNELTPTTVTVSGYAIRVGDPQKYALQYAQLNLRSSEAPTLLFAPNNYGETPALESEVYWGGVKYKVRAVEPVEPDSYAIIARIVIAK